MTKTSVEEIQPDFERAKAVMGRLAAMPHKPHVKKKGRPKKAKTKKL
jgi:predicted 2-oxoglutarate/Fe(II)-dependent dioxygenase YbiX